jgi:hypothetical protein
VIDENVGKAVANGGLVLDDENTWLCGIHACAKASSSKLRTV